MTMLKLQSNDHVVFDVELEIAKRSVVIQTMIESLGEDNLDEALPLTNVTAEILRKVIEFATHHKNDPMPNVDDKNDDPKTPLSEFDKNFTKVDMDTLCEYILAANYLDMKDLLNLCTAAVASHIKGQSPDTIREVCKRCWTKEDAGNVQVVNNGAVEEVAVEEVAAEEVAVEEVAVEEGDAKESDDKKDDVKESEPKLAKSEIEEAEENVQKMSVEDSDNKEAEPSVN